MGKLQHAEVAGDVELYNVTLPWNWVCFHFSIQWFQAFLVYDGKWGIDLVLTCIFILLSFFLSYNGFLIFFVFDIIM